MDARLNYYGSTVAAKFAKYINSAGTVVSNSTLPAATQELVKIRASQINGCAACTDMHTKDAGHAGESSVRLNLVAVWREAKVFTEAERAALELTEQVEVSRRARRAGGRAPRPRPRPSLPAGTDLLPQIRHIVVLMMENHSYDNYLGMLQGRGEGFTLGEDGEPEIANLGTGGDSVRAHHLSSTVQRPQVPSQSWHASHHQWGHGKCDGFVTSTQTVVSSAEAAGAAAVNVPPMTRRPAWGIGPKTTCRSITGWPALSRWPITGSARAWVPRSPIAVS